MSPRIQGAATQGTRGSTGFHQPCDGDRQPASPFFGEGDRGDIVVVFDRFERDLDDVTLLVDRDGDVTNGEIRFVFGLQGEIVGQVPGSSQVVEDLGNPLRECGELDLLALEDDEASSLARLEEEQTIAHLTAYADHDLVGGVEFVLHEAMSSLKVPVLLTLNTIGVEPVSTTALIEQVEMTVRWKRSRGTP